MCIEDCFHKFLQVPCTPGVLQPRYSRGGLLQVSLGLRLSDFESRHSSSASLHPELFGVVIGISPVATCEMTSALKTSFLDGMWHFHDAIIYVQKVS